MRKRTGDKEIILEILESCSFINEEILIVSKKDYVNSRRIRNSFLLELVKIGEGSNRLSRSVKSHYRGVAWEDIKIVRNKIAHNSYDLDLQLIWRIITEEVPKLEDRLEKILADFSRK